MTRNADNRTTELREKLTERGVEYTTNDHMGVCETSWNGFTVMQLTPNAKLIMVVTPKQAIAATMGGQRSTVEIAELLDEFEHECYMLRVEASETRAKDNVVRESYERIRDEFAGRIAVAGENDPYDTVSCEHVISSDTLHLILDEWDVHPGWTATNENMAQLFGHTAATLGGGKLTAEQVEKAIRDNSSYASYDGLKYYASGINLQAIADELNATVGNGTCDDLGGIGANGEMVFHCSKCGCILSLYDSDGMNTLCTSFVCDYPRFCPACVKAVER